MGASDSKLRAHFDNFQSLREWPHSGSAVQGEVPLVKFLRISEQKMEALKLLQQFSTLSGDGFVKAEATQTDKRTAREYSWILLARSL
jgi:hypothetical protein